MNNANAIDLLFKVYEMTPSLDGVLCASKKRTSTTAMHVLMKRQVRYQTGPAAISRYKTESAVGSTHIAQSGVHCKSSRMEVP